MTEIEHGGFVGPTPIKGVFYESNASWNYVMVNFSLRSHIVHHDQSGLSRPNHKGEE